MCDTAVRKLVFWALLSSSFTCLTVRIKRRTEDGCNGEDRQGNWRGGGTEEEAEADENCEISPSLIKALV